MHQPIMDEEKKIPITESIAKPDCEKLKRVVDSYVDYLRSPDCTGSFQNHYESHILDEAIRTFYGEGIAEEIIQRLRKAFDNLTERAKKSA